MTQPKAPSQFLARIYKNFKERAGLPAITDGQRTLSYGELDRITSSLAGLLSISYQDIERDVELLNVPAICVRMPHSLENIVAWVASARAGIPYVPLALDWPEARVEKILKNILAPVALTSREMAGDWPWSSSIQVLDICGLTQQFLKQENPSLDYPIHLGETPLYLIHTSGSTGEPKGIAISHANFASQFPSLTRYGMPSQGRMLHACSLSFDVSMCEVLATLLNGCTVVVAGPKIFLEASLFQQFSSDQRIDVCFIPSAVFNGLIMQDPTTFRSVKGLAFGGEAPNAESVKICLEACPETTLFHCYGPAECTVGAAEERITEQSFMYPLLPTGVATPGACLHVLDDNLAQLAAGERGEICIGGECVGLGYLGDPERTKASFVLLPETSERIFRTGDLGMMTEDGKLLVLGRMDDQVKISGYRVSPAEIISVVMNIPGVSNVHVGVRKQEPPELITWIMGEAGRNPVGVRDILARELPPYMVPAHIIAVDFLPLTSNGKVDVSHLPQPEFVPESAEGEKGKEILYLFQKALSKSSFKETDAYMEHGGTSMKSLWLIAQIRSLTGVSVPMSLLLEGQTALTVRLYVDNAQFGQVAASDSGQACTPENTSTACATIQMRF